MARAADAGSCRVASPIFVTGCLTEDVTRHFADEALSGLLSPRPHAFLKGIELSQAVHSGVTCLELDEQLRGGLIRALLEKLGHLIPVICKDEPTSPPWSGTQPPRNVRKKRDVIDECVHLSERSE